MQQHVFVISSICAEAGISHVVICPGSRSAPLVQAFAGNLNFNCISVIDERSAGFIALGIARQTKKTVAVICTSGTASVNLFPAVAEAYYQRIPLLILSADRPPELLNQQDGQMIMQKGVFGKHVLNSHEMPCLSNSKENYQLAERVIIQALRECNELYGPGPVHVNVPLREPLYLQKNEPVLDYKPPKSLKKDLQATQQPIQNTDITESSKAYEKSNKVLIIIGQHWVDVELSAILNKLSHLEKVVIFADVVSNQNHIATINNFDAVLQYANQDTLENLKPDFILSIGGPMVSKSLKNWLTLQTPPFHLRLQSQPIPVNTYNNVTQCVMADVNSFLQRFITNTHFLPNKSSNYTHGWKQLSEQVKQKQQIFFNGPGNGWFEPTVINYILNSLPNNVVLHVGNSSVIRFLSWLGLNKQIKYCFGNRGTSGIDGSNGLAIGSAIAAPALKHVLLVGDLSFWYDNNAFWLNHPLPQNLIIFVLNNHMGNIFNWIDGPGENEALLPYYTTPQQRNIKDFTLGLNANYIACSSQQELTQSLNTIYTSNRLTIVELMFNNTAENNLVIKTFKQLSI